jgi:hypothetical protein
MAQTGFNTIQLYHSTTASAVPSAGNLANGELALNITDGKLFYKDNLGVVQSFSAGGGSMVYPSAGIAVSTGSAWGTSLTAPTGTIVGTTDTQTLTNKTLTDPTITGTITEDVFTITDAAGFAIDPTNGSIQLITLGASRTPTQANWAAGESVTLMVNDGTAYTITWSTIGVVWVGGVAPTLATTGYTVIQLWKVGTTVYGATVGAVA